MGLDLDSLRSLIKLGHYESCVDLARQHLSRPQATQQAKAMCQNALCEALMKLRRYTEAAEAGMIAAYLAEESQQWDLFGDSVIFLSGCLYHLGRYQEAAATVERFFPHLHDYQESRGLEGHAHLNLGVYLREAGDDQGALASFRKAYDWWRNRQPALQEQARSYLVWQMLTLGDLAGAQKWISVGDQYVKDHPDDTQAITFHVIDKCRLFYLQGRLPDAAARAIEAIELAPPESYPMARTLMLLARVMLAATKPDSAITMGLRAKLAAEKADRPDIVAEAVHFLERQLVHNPEAWERVARRMTASKSTA